MRRTTTRVLAIAAVTALVLLVAAPAFAHEERTIGGGRFHVEVGWATEPVYGGYPNAVQVLLHDKNDKPILDLGDTLKVDVSSGGKTRSLSFEAAFEPGGDGTPGDYRASLIPTRPGTYAFRVNGTIKGVKIDETFTCSDKTFGRSDRRTERSPGGLDQVREGRRVARQDARLRGDWSRCDRVDRRGGRQRPAPEGVALSGTCVAPSSRSSSPARG
ncbi:MAG: hypothetical protein E6G68_06265 [Actinobacteria bacterium]|nr:MAG: hypothetical protein E6G68_06265 [Actinomycetota bacterium]